MVPRAQYDLGFEEALARTLQALAPLAPVAVPIGEAEGLVAAQDLVASTDCPSASISLKDGYAVLAADVANASTARPARLKVIGTAVAGPEAGAAVRAGTAVKITSGARIPPGADAVIPCEFTTEEAGWVLCRRDAGTKRNIFDRGRDIARGQRLVGLGDVLTPARTGLLAAGGMATIRVHRRPRIGIIAVGDEVVAPGTPLADGQLYASNLVTLRSWLRHFHMDAEIAVIGDHRDHLARQAANMLERVDVILTSGGAWKSERDLTIDVLRSLGAELAFHRVRMGPGKAVALLTAPGKTLFCLPGGPPSNEIAFLQIALPGLLRLSGRSPVPFEHRPATLTRRVGGDKDWTQFLYATLQHQDSQWLVSPLEMTSRLQAQAAAEAMIKIPEGSECLDSQSQICVQVLRDRVARQDT